MGVQFKQYVGDRGFSGDYEKVRRFLLRINENEMVEANFLWARWEWMHSLTRYMDEGVIPKIGLWIDDDKIVALATCEISLGAGFFVTDPSYEYLKEDMLSYAIKTHPKDGTFKALISNTDRGFQKIAASHGLVPSQDSEETAVLEITDDISYKLPDGFSVHSLADGYDENRLSNCKYRGFDNGDKMPESDFIAGHEDYTGPNLNKNIHLYVKASDGGYAAHCGSWYDEDTDYAYIEPVCTDPDYRKLGCAKAVVLEAIKRCGQLGAKKAFVISSQQFYYNIGFYPHSNHTWWSIDLEK